MSTNNTKQSKVETFAATVLETVSKLAKESGFTLHPSEGRLTAHEWQPRLRFVETSAESKIQKERAEKYGADISWINRKVELMGHVYRIVEFKRNGRKTPVVLQNDKSQIALSVSDVKRLLA